MNWNFEATQERMKILKTLEIHKTETKCGLHKNEAIWKRKPLAFDWYQICNEVYKFNFPELC